MTLDTLYDYVKDAKYPIRSRDELIEVLGDIEVEFEGDVYDARDIGTMITQYPITKASHVVELFIHAAEEEYSDDEAEDFEEFEDKM